MNVLLFIILILILILSFIVCEFTKFNKFNNFIKGGRSKNKLRVKSSVRIKQPHTIENKNHTIENKNHTIENKNHTIENKNSSNLYAMSYTISGEDNGLDFTQLRKLLTDAAVLGFHFVEKPVTERVHISFGTFKNDAVVKGEVKRWNYDPLFFKQKTAIKNTLGEHHQLINKSELYNTVKRLIPNGIKYLPKSYTVAEFEEMIKNRDPFKCKHLDDQNIYILKKDKVPQQQAIKLLSSKDEYFTEKSVLNIKNDAIISEYITNPLLLEGKKFNLRVHFLLSIVSGIIKCIIIDGYGLFLAKEKYKKGDWKNPDIHLSGGYNSKIYKWPDNVRKEYPNDIEKIKNNLNKCNQFICSLFVISAPKCYPESYAGFHIYGIDIIITDNYKPYLLEINHKPGHRVTPNQKKFFSLILDNVIFPFFGIKRPIFEKSAIMASSNYDKLPKCILIPYLDFFTNSKNEFIELDKKLKNDKIWTKLINSSQPINIFLINKPFKCHCVGIAALPKNKPFKKGFTQNQQLQYCEEQLNADIIGYLGLNNDNYLIYKLQEENQNEFINIMTALITQFIEIMIARTWAKKHIKIIKISKNDIQIHQVAKILNFKLNYNGNYEYKYLK
jgi:hypothetical protein